MEQRKIELRGQRFFLTYSQCPIDKHTGLRLIKEKFLLWTGSSVKKYIVAEEKHEDGGDHLHIYADLGESIRIKVDSNCLDFENFHPNIQAVKSPKRCQAYCKKNNNYVTNLTWEEQKVTKKELGQKIIDGCNIVELVKEYPQLLFGLSRTIADRDTFINMARVHRTLKKCRGWWIAGGSGVGKSFCVRKLFPDAYIKDPRTKWWEGYAGQEIVICDDLGADSKSIAPYLKPWADCYPDKFEKKGGEFYACPLAFIVTSNKSIERILDIWEWPVDDREPYRRRFREFWVTERGELNPILEELTEFVKNQ